MSALDELWAAAVEQFWHVINVSGGCSSAGLPLIVAQDAAHPEMRPPMGGRPAVGERRMSACECDELTGRDCCGGRDVHECMRAW